MAGHVPWDIRVTLDLFLGGLGIGVFIIAALLNYHNRERYERLVYLCAHLAPALAGVGLLFLISELGMPHRFMTMAYNFNPESVTAWGAYIQGAFLGLSVIYLYFLRKGNASEQTMRAIEILGSAAAVFVGVYHGLLLASLGRPLWAGGMVSVLFLVSSFLGATALVLILKSAVVSVSVSSEARSQVAAANAEASSSFNFTYLFFLLALTNLALLCAWQISIFRAGTEIAEAAAAMMKNYGTMWNTLVLGAGLAVPLLLSIVQLMKGAKNETPKGIALTIAVLALFGTFTFKYIVLSAGQFNLPFFI